MIENSLLIDWYFLDYRLCAKQVLAFINKQEFYIKCIVNVSKKIIINCKKICKKTLSGYAQSMTIF